MTRSPQPPQKTEPPPSGVWETVTDWLASLRVYREPACWRMLALGFSAGLPLLLVLGTLSFRLREAGIDRTTIGFLSWVGLAYAFKWTWAPLVDRLPLPLLQGLMGRRRSWLLLAQVMVTTGLVGMALTDPKTGLNALVAWAVLVAFGSATQDIALDAYRIESADARLQAALAATYQAGYRLAMIWAGAGVLWLAAGAQTGAHTLDQYQPEAWRMAYLMMALSMAVGIVTVVHSPEPPHTPLPPARNWRDWLHGAIVAPFADFLQRHRWQAVGILGLIAIYRISDVVMGIMANPFYVDMGFTKGEVAAVTKVYGVVMTLLGAFLGGALAQRMGVLRVLMLGAALSAVTNLLFIWLQGRGHDVNALVLVVSADNLGGGIASAAFIAYLSSLTHVRYSATQYALLSSTMLLAPKFLAGFSGWFVDQWGYTPFFLVTAAMGLPVLALVAWVARHDRSSSPASPAVE